MSYLPALRISRAPLASFAAMGVLWGSFAALVPSSKAMLGATDAQFGLLYLGSSLAAVAAMLVAARLGGRLGRMALPVATFAMAGAFALPGHFAVIWMFAMAMVLTGATSGLLDVLMNARVSMIESTSGRHLMNLNHGTYSLGYVAGAVMTGFLRDAGASPAQVLMQAAALAALLACLTFERDARIDGLGRKPRGAGPLGPVPLWGGIIVLVAFLAENAAEAWSALHIERTLGGSVTEGSLGPALVGLTMAFGRLAGHGIAARVDEARLMRGAATIAALGALIAALAPVPWVAHLGLMVLGLGVSVIAPTALAIVGRLAEPQARARAIARASVLGYLGFFFGPPLLGGLSELFGLRMSFAAVAVLLIGLLPIIPVLLAGRGWRG